MKRKILFLMIIFLILFKVNVVHASTLQREFIDNVWSFHYRNNSVWTYGQLNIKHIDGKIGYCIEPDSAVNTDQYTSTNDWSKSTFSDDIKEKMQLIAYYGYQYPNHNTIKYYMATQELIWLFSEDEKIKWTKEDHSDSEEISVESEKKEILNLIEKHNILPSFSKETYTDKINNTIKIKDENSVMNLYNFDSKYVTGQNELSIKVEEEPITIKYFQRKLLYNETLVYTSNIRSQRIATFSNPKLNSSYININPEKVTFSILKKDKDTNNLITDSGNKVIIKNLETEEEINTEFVDGKIILELLPGNYSIEELLASNGYLINKDCIKFNVDYNSENSIDYYNKKVYGKIKIKKVDTENNLLKDCTFNIYDLNNNIVDTIKTTLNEYDESKLLPLGEYYIKEEKAFYGYKRDNRVYKANLKYKDSITPIIEKELTVINEKIKCNITIIGVDENDNNLDITYNIFDKNNNLVYTGNNKEISLEYVNNLGKCLKIF